MEVLPNDLHAHKRVKTLLNFRRSGIYYKRLDQSLSDKIVFFKRPALIHLLEGKFQSNDPDGRSRSAHAGQWLVLPKDLYTVSDYLNESGEFSALLFFFDEALFANFYSTSDLNQAQDCFSSDSTLDAYSQSLLTTYSQHNISEVTELKLLELLHLIASKENGATIISALKPTLSNNGISLIDFMERHYRLPISLKDFALACGLSPYRFSQQFQSHYQQNPKQWLIEKRLRFAKAELEKYGNTNLRELATTAGFNNYSHFIQVFRKHFGCTPGETQKKAEKLI